MLGLKKQMLKSLVTSQLQDLGKRNIEFSFDIDGKKSHFKVKNQEMTDKEIKVFVEEKETGKAGQLTFWI